MNLFRISMSLLVLLTVWHLSPRTALAAPRQQADSCAEVRTWYRLVDDLKQQIEQRETDPTVSFGTRNPQLYRDAAAALRDAGAPDEVAQSQSELIDGFEQLATHLDQLDAIDQRARSGNFATFQDYYATIAALSEARRSLMSGYLGWSVAGVSCGLQDDQFVPSDIRACDGVAGYIDTAAAVIEGFWNVWWQSFHDRQGTQGQQTDTSANPLGPGEQISFYAYQDGLKLAETPAPERAMPLQRAIVANMLAMSDLYLIDVIGAWAAYFGLDQAARQQIIDQFTQQQTLAMDQQDAIERDWNDLNATCGLDRPYPRATWDRT